jgi:hypothetical protein
MEAMRGRRKRWTLGPAVAEEAGITIPLLGQSLEAIIVFWAIVGGLGASLLLPAMHVALLVPILAGLLGLFNGFRMVRVPEPAATRPVEGVLG